VIASDHIGQYRILRKLGAGGMGMVFVGEHRLIHRRAAIKTLKPELSRRPEVVERFFNEARATSAISDPGIVQIFDFGYHVDGTAYIVMELLEGEGLADRLDRLGTLPIASALRIARQVASSLAAAHARRIVHRDLKPENIFLVRDCEAQGGERTKILDFGICAVGDAPETDVPPETMIGTPVYMSPEQCRGAEQGDPRSDVYGLGCVLFQMLTGSAPFERDSVRDLLLAHLVEEPPAVSSLREDVPPLVEELVRRCLAKSPEDRFSSMTALGAAIEHAIARLSGVEPAVAEVPPAVPLGTGFRSAFDANPVARELAREAAREVASAEPRASCSLTLVERRRAPLRRAGLAIALLGGAVLASLATRLTDDDGAMAHRAPASSTISTPSTPSTPSAPPPALAAPPQVQPVVAAPVVAVSAPEQAPAAAPPMRLDPPPVRPVLLQTPKPPSSQRPAAPPPVAQPGSEDLYDMR